VHHGLDIGPEHFVPSPDDYLVFVGRLSREKGPDRAVEIATALGMKLKIAAKVDEADRDYYERELVPRFQHPLVEFMGELDEPRKLELMGHARAFLMPIDWPEPFGLVAIEAMACGTPVLAFRKGSMPEVIDDGVTGVLVDDIPHALEATRRLLDLPREAVRSTFDRRFSGRRMAEDYVRVYERLLEQRRREGRGSGKTGATELAV
jgi:glycosyltransferase involved in cell wall biosynthesis